MTRRQFLIILAGAADEQSREIARRLYARGHRGERDRGGKLVPLPTVAPKAPKKRRKFGEMTQE